MILFLPFSEWNAYLLRENLTINQVYFMHLLMTQDSRALNQYLTKNGRAFASAEIHELFDRGYVLDLNSRKGAVRFSMELMVVPEHIQEKMPGTRVQHAEELWLLYPDYIPVRNILTSAKTTDHGKDFLLQEYMRRIRYSEVTHKEVMQLTEKAKLAGMLTTGIQKYVYNELWTGLRTHFSTEGSSYTTNEL